MKCRNIVRYVPAFLLCGCVGSLLGSRQAVGQEWCFYCVGVSGHGSRGEPGSFEAFDRGAVGQAVAHVSIDLV